MMGQATSTTGGTGTARSRKVRRAPNYANKRAKIRSNTLFDNSGSGNPAGEYTVELFPDGTVRSVWTSLQASRLR
jgi:colicin import membrane protein